MDYEGPSDGLLEMVSDEAEFVKNKNKRDVRKLTRDVNTKVLK